MTLALNYLVRDSPLSCPDFSNVTTVNSSNKGSGNSEKPLYRSLFFGLVQNLLAPCLL